MKTPITSSFPRGLGFVNFRSLYIRNRRAVLMALKFLELWSGFKAPELERFIYSRARELCNCVADSEASLTI